MLASDVLKVNNEFFLLTLCWRMGEELAVSFHKVFTGVLIYADASRLLRANDAIEPEGR